MLCSDPDVSDKMLIINPLYEGQGLRKSSYGFGDIQFGVRKPIAAVKILSSRSPIPNME
jgi:hypothetical protein